jgi:hypothetical protein
MYVLKSLSTQYYSSLNLANCNSKNALEKDMYNIIHK